MYRPTPTMKPMRNPLPDEPDSLPDDAGSLRALVIAARAEDARLNAIIKALRRHVRPASAKSLRTNWP